MTSYQTHVLSREAQLVQCLILILAPSVAAEAKTLVGSHHTTGTRCARTAEPSRTSSPYLAAGGAIALRFEEPIVPLPEAPTAPVVALPVRAVEASDSHPRLQPGPQVTTAETPAPKPKAEPTAPAPPAEPPPKPLSLIPDDTKRDIQPEDVLPFFQLPTSGDTPPPRAAPPSSATYQQH